jgi:AAA ATPase domain/Transcriptional regulatory protein, C terminal
MRKRNRLATSSMAYSRCCAADHLSISSAWLSRDTLEAVGPKTVVSESALTVAIRHLRRVLGDRARTPQFIETVHRRGYRFMAPVAAAEPSPERHQTAETWRLPLPVARIQSGCFVGRAGELAQVHQWFRMALQGTRQVGIIAGEPGIGKTAMVDELVRQQVVSEGPEGWEARAGLDSISAIVPSNLRALIELQLANLSSRDQTLFEAASVAGVEFSAGAVAAALEHAEEVVEARCTALAHRGQLLQACGQSAGARPAAVAAVHQWCPPPLALSKAFPLISPPPVGLQS